MLTFASKTGDFQTYNGLFISGQEGLVPAYTPSSNPDNLTLTASTVVNYWLNPVSGDWDTASNWTYGVPVAGQSVAIPYSGITVTHTQATVEPMIASLDDLATLDITNGSIAVGNGSSTLGGPVTIGAAGTLSVAAGAHVLVESTLSDAGAVTFSTGDAVTLAESATSVSGSLTANGTTFTNECCGSSSITFTPTATLSGGTNNFDLPISVPYTLVPSLAGNTSFDVVEIQAATLSSGTLTLDELGTVTTNFYYEFPNGFTVAAGGTMMVGPGVPITVVSALNDAGAVTFSTGDAVTLAESATSVSGSLTANGTTFTNECCGSSSITFTPTATLSGGTNNFDLPISVPYALVPSLAGNTSFDVVEIQAATLSSGTLTLDELGTVTTNFYYEFPDGFTVAAGGTMMVGPGVPITVVSALNDAGAVTFSTGDAVTLAESATSVSGSLTANGTTFTNGAAAARPSHSLRQRHSAAGPTVSTCRSASPTPWSPRWRATPASTWWRSRRPRSPAGR